jgi:hypothetical protein
MTNPYPFLLRNLPDGQRELTKKEFKIKELEDELNFYKSIFSSYRNSAIFNLRIKKINGTKVWIDKLNVYSDHQLLHSLDLDEEVEEWKKPVRCSR